MQPAIHNWDQQTLRERGGEGVYSQQDDHSDINHGNGYDTGRGSNEPWNDDESHLLSSLSESPGPTTVGNIVILGAHKVSTEQGR